MMVAATAAIGSAIITLPMANAEITVKPTANGYDIDVTEQASASALIDAIASATGVDVKGEPDDTPIAPNHFRSTSLVRVLRTLLPHTAFVIRSDDDGSPEAIIFMSASSGSSDDSGGSDDAGTSGSDEGEVSGSDGVDDQSNTGTGNAPEDVSPAGNALSEPGG